MDKSWIYVYLTCWVWLLGVDSRHAGTATAGVLRVRVRVHWQVCILTRRKVRHRVCFNVNNLSSTSNISIIPAYNNGHPFHCSSLWPARSQLGSHVLCTSRMAFAEWLRAHAACIGVEWCHSVTVRQGHTRCFFSSQWHDDWHVTIPIFATIPIFVIRVIWHLLALTRMQRLTGAQSSCRRPLTRQQSRWDEI